jgi:hypothetical protein
MESGWWQEETMTTDYSLLAALRLDWAAVALSFAAIRQLGKQRRNGFVFFMLANLCWIGFGSLAGNMAMLLGNVVFLANNLLAYWQWQAVGKAPEQAQRQAGGGVPEEKFTDGRCGLDFQSEFL